MHDDRLLRRELIGLGLLHRPVGINPVHKVGDLRHGELVNVFDVNAQATRQRARRVHRVLQLVDEVIEAQIARFRTANRQVIDRSFRRHLQQPRVALDGGHACVGVSCLEVCSRLSRSDCVIGGGFPLTGGRRYATPF